MFLEAFYLKLVRNEKVLESGCKQILYVASFLTLFHEAANDREVNLALVCCKKKEKRKERKGFNK